MDTLLPV